MRRLLTLLLVLLWCAPVYAATEAGRVVFVAGEVTAERQPSVTLKKNDSVYGRDVIVTAERSRAQLLMKDGAKIALRAQTRFLIEEYLLAGEPSEQPDGSVVVTTDDSAVTELIKGGFRTITGTIGRSDPASYEVRTPAATMGIRGTFYSVVWCAGDCLPPPGATVRAIDDGLYVGVTEGVVYLVNNAGALLLRAGEYAYVRDRNTAPVKLSQRPPALYELPAFAPVARETSSEELRQTIRALGSAAATVGFSSPDPEAVAAAAKFVSRRRAPGADRKTPGPGAGVTSRDLSAPPYDGSVAGFDAEIEREVCFVINGACVPVTDGTLPTIQAVTLASGPLQNAQSFSASSATGVRTLTGNDLSGFDAPLPGGSAGFYSQGTAGVRDDGFDPLTRIRWGRWAGGAAALTLADGSTVQIGLASQSLHWVFGPQLLTRPVLPMTGTANFLLIAGNTDPTDNLGNTGVLGGASLFADFTNSTVASDLTLSIGGARWVANGSGVLTGELFNGMYNSVLVGGQAGGSGQFSGFLGQPAANGFPGGAGLGYGLTDGLGTSVSGVVVFGQPEITP